MQQTSFPLLIKNVIWLYTSPVEAAIFPFIVPVNPVLVQLFCLFMRPFLFRFANCKTFVDFFFKFGIMFEVQGGFRQIISK